MQERNYLRKGVRELGNAQISVKIVFTKFRVKK